MNNPTQKPYQAGSRLVSSFMRGDVPLEFSTRSSSQPVATVACPARISPEGTETLKLQIELAEGQSSTPKELAMQP